jgi:cobalt-zinc-cadmium efflux system outer membrane protein
MQKTAFAAAAVVVCAAQAAAQQGLSLDQVLARARAQAPQVLSAAARIEEARSRMIGARLRARENPTVETVIGPRLSDGSRSTDFDVSAGQLFEPGSRRTARIAGAEAGIDRDSAAADDMRRQAASAAADAFYRALEARERREFLAAAEALAVQMTDIAQRRYRAGDIAVLDVNVGQIRLSRARAERQKAEAAGREALGNLRTLLDLSDEALPSVSGTLGTGGEKELSALLDAATRRPDLRVLEAERRDADADVAFGRSFGRPDWGWTAQYSREQRDTIVKGGLSLTLPIFNRGQDLTATGFARVARLEIELDTARRSIATEVRSAYDVLQIRLAVVNELEQHGVTGADQNDALARRSFEVGEIRLVDWLLIRRELLETRLALLDAKLEAALARVRLYSAAGVLQ